MCFVAKIQSLDNQEIAHSQRGNYFVIIVWHSQNNFNVGNIFYTLLNGQWVALLIAVPSV